MSTPPDGRRSLHPALSNFLTSVSHGATPFMMTYLLIHLSAPALANLGGSSLSSQVMILGREFYQTSFGEKALVLAPITLHVLASGAKRAISPKGKQPRPLKSTLTISGIATAAFFLPVHFVIHRIYPKSDAAPILAVGPSELDYEFVKYGLQNWPWRSCLLYGGLLGALAIHVAEGLGLVSWLKGVFNTTRRAREKRRDILFGGVVLPVLSGLFFIVREPPMIFSSIAQRYHAVFQSHWIYRL